MLLSLDISVLYLALPRLSADLGADATQQLWILDIYSFMIAGLLVTMGTLGDRIGRRKLLLLGAGAFGVASVVAAYATTPEMLIAARALLGIAGATLMPSTMALIRNMFPDPQQMAFAISVWFSCFMGGMTLGPLVGGLLLEHYWWGSAFLLGVPFMVLLLVVGPRLLPEYRDPEAGRLDLTSVVLSLAAILPVIYGLKETAKDGLQLTPVAAVVIGAAFAVAFIRRQRRLTNPLLDVGLFANRPFSTGLGIMLGAGVVMAGISLLSAVYLQSVIGLTPMEAGLWLIPQNVAMVIGSLVAPAARQARAPDPCDHDRPGDRGRRSPRDDPGRQRERHRPGRDRHDHRRVRHRASDGADLRHRALGRAAGEGRIGVRGLRDRWRVRHRDGRRHDRQPRCVHLPRPARGHHPGRHPVRRRPTPRRTGSRSP